MKEYPGVHGAAMEYLARKFGGVFDIRIKSFTSSPTRDVIVEGDPERVWLSFQDSSGVQHVLTPQKAPSGVTGFVLGVDSRLTFDVENDALLPALKWWAAASAGGDILVVELYRTHKLSMDKD